MSPQRGSGAAYPGSGPGGQPQGSARKPAKPSDAVRVARRGALSERTRIRLEPDCIRCRIGGPPTPVEVHVFLGLGARHLT